MKSSISLDSTGVLCVTLSPDKPAEIAIAKVMLSMKGATAIVSVSSSEPHYISVTLDPNPQPMAR